MSDHAKFPDNFLWGCATASYQVEGAFNEGGRGLSVWDDFTSQPGRIAGDHNGNIAVDQYHRYKEDVQLMKWLGVKAYRFSVAWPRIFPDGDGKPNPEGLDYYKRLADELLANGIEPWMTLYHWDLPLTLQKKHGGWQSREVSKLFGEYAGFMAANLSDRVKNYFTINEFMFIDSGYDGGPFPPGMKLGRKARNNTRHNALMGHGLATLAIRANAKTTPNVGFAENSIPCAPVYETDEHIAATKKAYREINGHFITAVMEGKYPDSYFESEKDDMPDFTEDEMKIISTPLDFVGLNIYTCLSVRAASDTPSGYEVLSFPESYPRYDMPWLHFAPQATYWGPRITSELWKPKAIYITENGAACKDKLTLKKEVLDIDRILYVRNHLAAAQRAARDGFPLKGYFAWSLLDNFEWAEGYNKRFGMIYVNYSTLERTPKLSAHFYRELIAKNSIL